LVNHQPVTRLHYFQFHFLLLIFIKRKITDAQLRGFNCGSSFGNTEDKWLVATRAGVSTINATAGTRTPHHRHDATTKRMNSYASKIMIGKDEDNDDIVRLAMVQFCKMCSESDFEDV
jgi:hypothetical protein